MNAVRNVYEELYELTEIIVETSGGSVIMALDNSQNNFAVFYANGQGFYCKEFKLSEIELVLFGLEIYSFSGCTIEVKVE